MKSIRSGVIISVVIAGLALANMCLAQEATRNREGLQLAPPQLKALTNATIHISPGHLVKNGTLLINGSRIKAVQQPGQPIPKSAIRIDLTDHHIYAGFVESWLPTSFRRDAEETAGSNVHWNRNVRSHISAADRLRLSDLNGEALRNAGFTSALVAPSDGILKGTSALALLGDDSDNPNRQIIRSPVAQHMQLTADPDGADGYPQSPMGAVALARQTLLDADWFRNARRAAKVDPTIERPESNRSLQALQTVIDGELPVMIDTSNELFVLRADRFAREFGLKCIIIGNGKEYRRLKSVARLERPMIVPLNFPAPPTVADPADALDVSLETLMHWDHAPENLARLADEGVEFAVTSNGLDDASEMIEHLRIATRRGLSRETALAALTTVPARIFGVADQIGTLETGKLANLTVTTGPLFENNSEVSETWIAGTCFRSSPKPVRDAAGRWKLRTRIESLDGQVLSIRGRGELEGTLGGPEFSDVREPGEQVSPTNAPQPDDIIDLRTLRPDRPALPEPPDRKESSVHRPQDNDTISLQSLAPKSAKPKRGGNDRESQPLPNRDVLMLNDLLPAPESITDSIANPDGRVRTTKTTSPATGARAPDRSGFRSAANHQKRGAVVNELRRFDARISGTFDGAPFDLPGDHRFSLVLIDDDNARGQVVAPNGMSTPVTAVRIAPAERVGSGHSPGDDNGTGPEPSKLKKGHAHTGKMASYKVNFPLGAYGRNSPPPAKNFLIHNINVWTCTDAGVIKGGAVLVSDGVIAGIFSEQDPLPDADEVIDGDGRHLTPGIIDCHSHMATDSGVNEWSQAVTAEVRIGDFIDCDDINIFRQLAGGVTTANILHGSANPIGGQNQVIKLRWGMSDEEMKFDEAPAGIKFALGENVKKVYPSDPDRYPFTRMGVEQIIRDRLLAAQDYQARHQRYRTTRKGLPPRTDLELEAISEILRGERWIHCHSYRQDEVLALLRTLDEFDITIGTFQHILEGYKVADKLAQHGAMASAFADWWAYKFEVLDAIPYAGALMHDAGVVVSFNSDDDEMGRHLNHEAAKAVKYGGVSEEEALKFVTLNPARQLRIDSMVGSIAVGKHADLALWSGPPLSPTTRCEATWVDGRKYFDYERAFFDAEFFSSMKHELIQKVLQSGQPPSAIQDSDPADLWPRHDEACHDE